MSNVKVCFNIFLLPTKLNETCMFLAWSSTKLLKEFYSAESCDFHGNRNTPSVISTVPARLSVRKTSCPLHISYTLFLSPHHKMWGLCWIRFVASVGRSVGRSVRPSVLLHYRVRSINPIPIEGFSSNLAVILTSLRGCAKPMLPLCQLNVKVTINGQISNSQMLDITLVLH